MRFLSQEQSRISRAAESVARDQLEAVASQISLTVETVQDDLLRALDAIPEERLGQTLIAWEKRNPLIRNVFIQSPDGQVVLPDREVPLTGEQSRFLRHYQTLFNGTVPWKKTLADEGGDTQPAPSFGRLSSPFNRAVLSRKPPVSFSPEPPIVGGWIPWFWETRMSFLGWVQHDPASARYGVEVEMVTLLAELLPVLPSELPVARRMALIDGSGRVVHQTGGLNGDDGAQPALRVAVGSTLPHWELALYTPDGTFESMGRGVAILSGMLVMILFVFLFGAGILLLREAHRNRKDAQQKTMFVSNVSHELKTPLTTIRMYAELLEDGRVKDPGKARRYLKTIRAESVRLTRLVNNVLDFSRLDQRCKNYLLQEVDVADLMREIIGLQQMRLQQTAMNCTSNLPEEPVPVRTDRDAVQQVVMNLIDNAVKYAASGKVLDLSLVCRGTGVFISVADRGAGIAPRDRARIFERFYRIDDSLTAESQGCGLGLSIARRMVEDLGGTLTYQPVKGGGSCFTVFIPGELNEENFNS